MHCKRIEALKAELSGTLPANVIALHPCVVKRYLAVVNALATSLQSRVLG